MSSLTRSEYNGIIEALSERKYSLVDEIKRTFQVEKSSRHLADLAVNLRHIEQTETYFVQLGLQSRSVFSPVSTRSIGTPEEVEARLAANAAVEGEAA
jgi:hypothetical protein